MHLSGIETQSQEMNMSDAIIAGSDATFDAEVLKSELPVLVDFWAPWCGPCLMIAPVVEEIAESHKGKLKVVKMNVDENGQTSQTYGVMAIPTLILYKGGQVAEKVVGVLPKNKLVDLIAKHV
jgi:thioredoxin 1